MSKNYPPQILLVYGTRFGSTEEIALQLSRYLQMSNVKVNLVNAKKAKKYDFDNYRGVLMISSIKLGKWTKGMRKFVKRHKNQITEHKDKVFAMVSSGYAADPTRYESVKKEYLEDFFKKMKVPYINSEIIGGVLDFGNPSRHGYTQKILLKTIIKADKSFTPEVNLEEVNDYRDWEKVNKFANEFLTTLQLKSKVKH
jgi:menaquinone-dependent protoporphyrinogen oxidase